MGRVRYGGARGRLTERGPTACFSPTSSLPSMPVRNRSPAAIPTPWSAVSPDRPLLHHHPQAQKPAQSDRGDTRRCLDADSLLDGRRRRCGRDHLSPPSRVEPDAAPVAAHRVRRVKPAPGSGSSALFARLQLSRLHHRPGRGDSWNWRPTIAATPRSRTPYATSSTASG